MSEHDDDLTEYVSRRARKELVGKLIEKSDSLRNLARNLGVSAKAVRKWIEPNGTHPSNLHLQRVLALSLDADWRGTIALLRRNLQGHRASLRRFLEELGDRGGG